MQEIEQKLELVFRSIYQERMQGLPMCNPDLQVEAVGFRKYGDHFLGILITPWFMNLMLLPANAEVPVVMREGDKEMHAFPSGYYEFIHAMEEELGNYQACSLFSPMFDFQDQETVVETAKLVLEQIMNESNRDTVSTREKTIEKIWKGEQPVETREMVDNAADESATSLEQRIEKQLNKPISRRDFLRGGWSRSREQGHGD